MFIELGAYQAHVFLDFREMADDAGGQLARLAAYLQGRGVASLERAGREMSLQPLHRAWRELCRTDLLQRQLDIFHGQPGSLLEGALWQELEEKIADLISRAYGDVRAEAGRRRAAEMLLEDLLALRELFFPERLPLEKAANEVPTARKYLQKQFREKAELERLFLLWLYARHLAATGTEKRADDRILFEEWMLDDVLAESLRGWGFSTGRVEPARLMIRAACGLGPMIRACGAALAQGREQRMPPPREIL